MKLIIGGREVHLVESDVKAARKMITHFMTAVKANAEEHNAPTLYMTTLVLMHLMSKNQIEALTPETLQLLLDATYKGTQNSNKKRD